MLDKLSWKDVLINQLIKSGFSKEESHSVYLDCWTKGRIRF